MAKSALIYCPEVPAQLRRRGEIVGLIFGASLLPLSRIGHASWSDSPSTPAGVALPMVILSFLAGALGCALGIDRSSPFPVGFAPRVGIRSGVVSALVCGSLQVLVATLHAFDAGVAFHGPAYAMPFSFLPASSRPYQTLVIALLGIPPALFFGMAGAFLMAMLRNPSSKANADAGRVQQEARQGRNPFLTGIVIISAIGYISPLALALRQPPKSTPIASSPPVPSVRPSPPPKWRYEKPEGFEDASADRVVISAYQTFEDIDTSLPFALSPNQRQLAYFSRSQTVSLVIRDLDSLDIVSQTGFFGEPNALSWSHDGAEIIFRTNSGGTTQLMIFDTGSNRMMRLPQPINGRLPQGRFEWWDMREVLFPGPREPSVLSLVTLQVRPVTDSIRWGTIGKERQEAIRRGLALPETPSSSRWKVKTQASIRTYSGPLDGSPGWSMQELWRFTIVDDHAAYRNEEIGADVNVGDIVIPNDDLTKIVRIRGRSATVIYFGLRNPPSNFVTIAMPGAPDAALSDALKRQALCAFVCGPLVNPLNNRVVGPDRLNVKAIARFSTWKDKEAELWINEEFLPILPGDVITDPHVWEQRVPKPVGELGRKEWFAPIEKAERTPPPPLREAPALDRELTFVVKSDKGADRPERFAPVAKPTIFDIFERGLSPRPSETSTGSAAQSPQLQGLADIQRRLSSFLISHHAKSSANDVDGLVADYADRVDYFDQGFVGPDLIRRSEIEYHAPATRVTETIVAGPVIAAIGGPNYSANYTISFERILRNGRWAKGRSTIEMHINLAGASPRITYQRSTSFDQQKGP